MTKWTSQPSGKYTINANFGYGKYNNKEGTSNADVYTRTED